VANDIDVRRLINFETATDGTAVRLVIEDIAGCTIGIILTIETLSALLMTLPTMASNAVKRAHNDPAMRITYPVTEFQIELSPGNFRILTIGTPDGFTVSFSLTEELRKNSARRTSMASVCEPKRTDRTRLRKTQRIVRTLLNWITRSVFGVATVPRPVGSGRVSANWSSIASRPVGSCEVAFNSPMSRLLILSG
jgi:hypothetical protein